MIITQVEVVIDHPQQTLCNCFSCIFKVLIPCPPHAISKAVLDHVLVRKLAGLVPQGSGELAPRLALTASLYLPSVVCVGSATGPTAFPAEASEAVVGGRLFTRSALSFLPSDHGLEVTTELEL